MARKVNLTYSEGVATLKVLFADYKKINMHKQLNKDGKLKIDLNFDKQASVFERVIDTIEDPQHRSIIEFDFLKSSESLWYLAYKDQEGNGVGMSKATYYKMKHIVVARLMELFYG